MHPLWLMTSAAADVISVPSVIDAKIGVMKTSGFYWGLWRSKVNIGLIHCGLVTRHGVRNRGHYSIIDSRHYSDVIMYTIASQITSLAIVYSTVYSGADQRKHQSSLPLASNAENVSIWWRHHVRACRLPGTKPYHKLIRSYCQFCLRNKHKWNFDKRFHSINAFGNMVFELFGNKPVECRLFVL